MEGVGHSPPGRVGNRNDFQSNLHLQSQSQKSRDFGALSMIGLMRSRSGKAKRAKSAIFRGMSLEPGSQTLAGLEIP